jgi:hypothetical protein
MDEGFVLPNAAAFHAMILGQVDDLTVVPHWLPDGSVVLTAQVRIAPGETAEVSRRAALLGAVPLVRQAVGGDLPPGLARRHLYQLK